MRAQRGTRPLLRSERVRLTSRLFRQQDADEPGREGHLQAVTLRARCPLMIKGHWTPGSTIRRKEENNEVITGSPPQKTIHSRYCLFREEVLR